MSYAYRRSSSPVVRRVLAALAVALLAACGGGGGGGGGGGSSYSVTVSPGSLTFVAEQGALPPAQDLTAGFNGDGLLVGWPAGTSPPSWLQLSLVSNTSSSAVIRVEVTFPSLPPGTYTATIRFVTGKADGSDYVVRDVPVTFTVNAPALTVTGNRSVSITEAAAAADLDLPLTVETNLSAAAGAACSWQVASSVPWLSVTPSSGTLAADTPVVAHLDPEALWTMTNFPYQPILTFTLGAGCLHSPGNPVAVSVNLDLQPALSAPASVAFAITDAWTPADARKTVALGSNVGTAFAAHAGWSASLGDDWVLLAPTAGTASATLTLDLAPSTIGSLAAGHHATTLAVVPDPKLAALSVPVTLDLDIPTVAHVSPYTTWVDRPSPVVIRGGGFGSGPTLAVRVGAGVVAATVVSPTELHATLPAQGSPGRLAVRVDTVTPRGGAELVVLPEPAYAATSVALAKAFTQIAQDPERQAVLLTGYDTQEVTRLRWDGAAWNTDRAVLADAQGAAVSVDGKDLLVVAGTFNADAHRIVTLDPETLESRSTAGFSDYYTLYSFIAPFDDGRTLLADTDQWPTFRWYPGFAIGPSVSVYSPYLLLTRDRRRLLVRPYGNTNYSDAIVSFDSTDEQFQTRFHPSAFYPWNWDVSGDGGRMLDGLDVYDRSFTKLGSIGLAAPDPAVSAVSPDGAFVYTMQQVASAWELRRTAVSAAAGPYAPDAAPLPFVLPPDQYPRTLRVSEDGSTLFLLATWMSGSGDTVYWLHVVPVP